MTTILTLADMAATTVAVSAPLIAYWLGLAVRRVLGG